MILDEFTADIEQRPAYLRELAGRLVDEQPWSVLRPHEVRRIQLIGMGSSRFAARVGAWRLRRAGVHAVAEYASDPGLAGGQGTLVVAISATGKSAETIAAAHRAKAAGSTVVALTDDPTSPLAELAGRHVLLGAGEERSGIVCRTYTHTLALLLSLERHLEGGSDIELDVAGIVKRSAIAVEDLLERRDHWIDWVGDRLDSTDGLFVTAPVARISSAEQSALMVRLVPRRLAVACETGDWSHVDVYLTKTRDYRMLLYPGSRWEPELLRWTAERRTKVVAVGNAPAGVEALRYAGDHDPLVAVLAETTVAEIVADLWRPQLRRPRSDEAWGVAADPIR
ncbi:MAG: SIS domain-containing protein [Actinomycetota bacterium]|nr:SIS domain-containing protein [Actinomycetota bacterium]